MTGRLVRWPLALYPRSWRNRYGAEVADLTDELIATGETTALRAGLNLILGAAIEQRRAAAASAGAVLVSGLLTAIAAAGIVLGVTRWQQVTDTKPYFDSHPIGVLLLVVVVVWLMLEVTGILQVPQRREGAIRAGRGGWWVAALACLIAANTWLYLAPSIVPVATIRHGGVAFAVGAAILVAGVILRGCALVTLGQYFTVIVQVSPDQPVVAAGPYRLVRHPGYAGGLLASIGVGLMSGNWVGLAAMTLLPLIAIVWRIRIEESALIATLDNRYRSYAAARKRLVPLVW